MFPRATYLVSIGNNINSHASPVVSLTISRALLQMTGTSKAEKLALEAEPVACDNKRKTCAQNFRRALLD